MKLDPRTITILKNFSSINSGLSVKKGNVISTINQGRSVLAKATIKDSFEKDFAIYDLNRFLATLSLFENPNIRLGEKSMNIYEKNQGVTYVYCESEFILNPPDKNLDIDKGDFSFKLTADKFQSLLKASAVMKLPNISVVGDGESIAIQALDSLNPTGDVFTIILGETDQTFNAVFKTELFKMINEDYNVEITKEGIAQFSGSDIVYWITVERKLSTF